MAEVLALKIRNSAAIKSIMKLTEKSNFLNLRMIHPYFCCNADSVEPTMKTLQKFHHLSGLKANIEKTKDYNTGTTDFDLPSSFSCTTQNKLCLSQCFLERHSALLRKQYMVDARK